MINKFLRTRPTTLGMKPINIRGIPVDFPIRVKSATWKE